MSNLQRLIGRIVRWLSAGDPTPALPDWFRYTTMGFGRAGKSKTGQAPIPTFPPATRARIQSIFDRAARRKLQERPEVAGGQSESEPRLIDRRDGSVGSSLVGSGSQDLSLKREQSSNATGAECA
jgi:hypothetical protein